MRIELDDGRQLCQIDIDRYNYSWAPFYFKEFYL